MNVLHVIASGARRGGEVFASDLVSALTKYELEQGVVVLHGPQPDSLALPVRAQVLSPSTRSFSAPSFDIGLVRALHRAIRTGRPDVVQAHGGEPLKYLSLACYGRPIVYRKIGATLGELQHGIRRAAFAAQMHRAARIIAVAEAVRRETIEVFRLSDSKVVTIPNAVDSARVHASQNAASFRRSLGLADDSLIITFLGAFTWEKDPLANLDVALRVLRRFPQAIFLMAGDGPLRDETEAVCRAEADHRVLVLGSRTDVGDILAATDVLLSASRTEGMPANVIEAGMAGVPVASYALSGIPEVVVDGKTGVLARPGDRAALEAGVTRLLSNPDARWAMGRAARARCLADFEIAAVAPRYLAVYQELTGR